MYMAMHERNFTRYQELVEGLQDLVFPSIVLDAVCCAGHDRDDPVNYSGQHADDTSSCWLLMRRKNNS